MGKEGFNSDRLEGCQGIWAIDATSGGNMHVSYIEQTLGTVTKELEKSGRTIISSSLAAIPNELSIALVLSHQTCLARWQESEANLSFFPTGGDAKKSFLANVRCEKCGFIHSQGYQSAKYKNGPLPLLNRHINLERFYLQVDFLSSKQS